MRISDWSSDVCSSDLPAVGPRASRLARPRCDPLGAGRLRNADSGVLRQQVDSGRNTWPSLDLACILQVEALTAPSRFANNVLPRPPPTAPLVDLPLAVLFGDRKSVV